MELKSFIKDRYSIKQSELYFNLPLAPNHTCPVLDELNKLLNSKQKNIVEEFRSHCNLIRQNVMQTKDELWTILDQIFVVDFPKKILHFNEKEIYTLMALEMEPVESFSQIKEFKFLVKSPELQTFGIEVLQCYENLLKWQKAYNTLLEDKTIIIEKIKQEFKGFKTINSVQ